LELYILDDDPAFLDLLDHAALMPYGRAFLGDKAHFHASVSRRMQSMPSASRNTCSTSGHGV
jgi:hypothetical protein